MDISVIICTYNRCLFLKKTLDSLILQDFPSNKYEIIVVDNNSTDGTEQAVNECKRRFPVKIEYVPEKRQGLSYARNAGIMVARGRVIAFIDDDAIAGKDWLREIAFTFEGIRPTPGCVGGKVLPIWELDRPTWLSDSLLTYLSILELGESPRWLRNNEFVAGTNMAFLKRILEKTGFFEVSLGRKLKSLLSSEENLLLQKLRSVGENVYYQPKAIVEHFIPEERLKKKWFLKRAFNQGISDYRMRDLMRISASINYNATDTFQVIKRILSGIVDITFGNASIRVNAMVYLITIVGYAYAQVYDHLKVLKR